MSESQLHQTIAITGSSGLMGRSLVPALLRFGNELRLLTRNTPPERRAGSTLIEGDLSDRRSLAELLHGADALVHLAGVAHTDLRSPEEHARAFAVNVTGTRNLFAAAKAAGVRRVLLVSSAHVYAGREGVDLPETAPVAGDGGYADMKIAAEAEARELQGHGCDVVILRPCLTYGPGVRFNLCQLMAAVKRGVYVHPGGADAVRSFVSVETVAAATAHLLHPGTPAGTYNIADREATSLRAWVDHLAALLEAKQPRTVPVSVLRSVAAVGSALARIGLPAPLTRNRLHKLTAPFSLSVEALRASGFAWPENQEAVLQAMVQEFLCNGLHRTK